MPARELLSFVAARALFSEASSAAVQALFLEASSAAVQALFLEELPAAAMQAWELLWPAPAAS
jgi:hypothetical protein